MPVLISPGPIGVVSTTIVGTPPTLDDWTYQFKDGGILLNGPSTVDFYDVEEISGLDMPEVKKTQVDHDGEHGASVFLKWWNPRTVVFTLTAYPVSSGNIQPMIDNLKANVFPDNLTYPLYLKHSGSVQRMLYCKVAGLTYAHNKDNNVTKQSMQLTFTAEDPRVYDVTRTTISSVFPSVTISGRTYPKTYPRNYGAAVVGGVFTAFNAGSADTPPFFTFTDKITNITIFNETTQQRLYIPVNMLTGDTLTVDCKTKKILLNGVRVRDYTLTNGWMVLPGGSNVVTVTAIASSSTSTASISFQSAWG